jgi:hypothetical protein
MASDLDRAEAGRQRGYAQVHDMATHQSNQNSNTSWIGGFARGARDWWTSGQATRSGRAALRQPPVGELSARPVYAQSSSDDEPNPWRDERDERRGRRADERDGNYTPVRSASRAPAHYSTPHGPYGRNPPVYGYDTRPPTTIRYYTPEPLDRSPNQTPAPITAAPRYYDMATGAESHHTSCRCRIT